MNMIASGIVFNYSRYGFPLMDNLIRENYDLAIIIKHIFE